MPTITVQHPAISLTIFYQDLGQPAAPTDRTLLLLHGFPESSHSWHKVVTSLLNSFQRIVLFDFPGFGQSDKPGNEYSYSLIDQADVTLLLWHQLGITGGHLLAHDMGDSVATELVAREVNGLLPAWFVDGFQSYTFTNGSMVIDLARLRITQRILLSKSGFLLSKLSNYGLFHNQVKSAHGNDQLNDEDIRQLWEQLTLQQGHRKMHLLIRYYNDRIRFEKSRWLPALAMTKVPTHLCWGQTDAVAPVAMAHYLKKHICRKAQLSILPDTGHFCQLSNPEGWLEAVLEFYEGLG